MRRSLQITLPAFAFLVAGGCVAAAADEVAESPPADLLPVVAAPVAPVVAAQVAPAIVDAAPTRRSFNYDGQMTQGGWIRGVAPTGAVSATLGDQALVLDEDGHFFAAFDRDSLGVIEIAAELADGSTISAPLTISPRDWNIEHVNIARRAGGASASFMERRQPELDAIWDARTAEAPGTGWSEDFIWPVTGRISGRFGSQRVYRGEPGSYHSGLDIATGSSGTPFVAPAAGVVTLATTRPFSLEGYLLIIDHGQGLNSAFLHMSEISVSEGDVVAQGQQIGRIGSSGRATGPHLHWSIKWHNSRLDPLLFIGPMP